MPPSGGPPSTPGRYPPRHAPGQIRPGKRPPPQHAPDQARPGKKPEKPRSGERHEQAPGSPPPQQERKRLKACVDYCQARQELSCEISSPLLTVPNITCERLKAARKALKEALSFLNNAINIPVLKEKLGIEIDFNDPDQYLPLMIKESFLDPSKKSSSEAYGYFQMRDIAGRDVRNKLAPFLKSPLPTSYTSPRDNCIYGILYFHLCQSVYTKGVKGIESLRNPEDKRLIALMAYNMGGAAFKELWNAVWGRQTPTSFADFERKTADMLSAQLGIQTGNATLTYDQNLNIDYAEYPAIAKCRELSSLPDGNPRKKVLENNFRNTSVKIGKLYQALKYAKNIQSISRLANNPAARPRFRIDHLTTQRSLRCIAKDLMLECQQRITDNLKMECQRENLPGCEKFSDAKILESWFQTLILAFNKQQNKLFTNIDIAASRLIIRDGTPIFIPPDDFINAQLKNLRFLTTPPAALPRAAERAPSLPRPEQQTPRLSARLYESTERPPETKGFPMYKPRDKKLKRDVQLEARGWQTLQSEGELSFDFERQPIQLIDHTQRDKKRRHSRKPRSTTTHIVLHSTDSDSVDSVINNTSAHYAIDKNGNIHYIVNKEMELNHAGHMEGTDGHKAIWNGDPYITFHSIGIEVAAKQGEEWNLRQYAAVRRLIHWLGPQYNIHQNSVVAHSQIACDATGARGRKPDPYKLNWERMGLPDNSLLIDTDLLRGTVIANLDDIQNGINGRSNRTVRVPDRSRRRRFRTEFQRHPWHGVDPHMIAGLRESASMMNNDFFTSQRRLLQTQNMSYWKRILMRTHRIIQYTVRQNDTLIEIARKTNSEAWKIRVWNSLNDSPLAVGTKLEIPVLNSTQAPSRPQAAPQTQKTRQPVKAKSPPRRRPSPQRRYASRRRRR